MFLYRAHRQSSASPAPLGHGTPPYRRPLSTAPNCPRRPSAAPRAGTWTAVVARLHIAPCDPHGGHASRPTADTPLFAPILHMVRADRILRYFAPAWTSRCASRVIAAPMCLTQYWLAPAALIILLPGIGHHTADSLYCRITLSSTKQVEAADHSSYVGSIPATRIVDISVRSTCWSCRQLSLLTSKSLSWRSPLITPPPLPHISRPQPAVPTLNFPIVSWPSTGASSVVNGQQYLVFAGWPWT